MSKTKVLILMTIAVILGAMLGIASSRYFKKTTEIVEIKQQSFDLTKRELALEFREIPLILFFCQLGEKEESTDMQKCDNYKDHLTSVENNMLKLIDYISKDKKCGRDFNLGVLMYIKDIAETIIVLMKSSYLNPEKVHEVLNMFAIFVESIDYENCTAANL